MLMGQNNGFDRPSKAQDNSIHLLVISAYPNNDSDDVAVSTDILSDHRSSLPLTIFVPYQERMNLSKLGVLSDVCHDVLHQQVSLKDAVKQLKAIDNLPAPWGSLAQMMCFMVTGANVAIIFRGSWNDVWIAAIGSLWCFVCLALWPKLFARGKAFLFVAYSFVSGVLATLVYVVLGNVNVTVSVLSSVIIPVPGYSISKGIDELVNDRILLGTSHCIQGIATLLWLALGGYGGKTLVMTCLAAALEEDGNAKALLSDNGPHEAVSFTWMALAVPVLCACLAVVLQIACRDFLSAVFVTGMAFVTFYGASLVVAPSIGALFAAAVTTILANAYGRVLNRPKTIVLVPAILLLVSGSIGFRGI